MSSNALRSIILPCVIIIAGFAAVVGLSGYLDRNRVELPDGYEDSDLAMNGSKLKGFALGFEGLMADWYWMRSLQYIGGKIVNAKTEINIDDLRDLNPRLLYPYLDNATDLDPHFIAAYSYGAVILPAIDPEKAIAITQKGIEKNPTEWRLYQHLGYIYWKLGRYAEAADTYEKGSQISGSSSFMQLMAASMRTEGGSRATSRAIYRQMLADSQDEAVTITAKRRLMGLDSLDEREAIDRVLADFKEKNGRCANSFGEIANALFQVQLPEGRTFRIDASRRLVDPSDAPYVLDKENCKVKLDPNKTAIALQ